MQRLTTVVALLVLAVAAQAQMRTVTIIAKGQNAHKFTDIASGGSLTQDFIWGPRDERSDYSGFGAYYAWCDTATGGAGARDSLKIDLFALQWDELSSQYEIGTTGLLSAGNDSINVAQYISWGTNHSDNVYTVSKPINMQASDGVRAVVSNTGAALKFRHVIKFTQN